MMPPFEMQVYDKYSPAAEFIVGSPGIGVFERELMEQGNDQMSCMSPEPHALHAVLHEDDGGVASPGLTILRSPSARLFPSPFSGMSPPSLLPPDDDPLSPPTPSLSDLHVLMTKSNDATREPQVDVVEMMSPSSAQAAMARQVDVTQSPVRRALSRIASFGMLSSSGGKAGARLNNGYLSPKSYVVQK